MASSTVELDLIIRARDQASRALRNVQGATGRLGSALAKLGKMAVLGAAAGLVALGAAALKFGSDFQSAFNTIRVGTGATGEALAGLNEDFKAVLRTGPEAMDVVADSIASLNTITGETGNSLRAMSRNALDAARITGTEAGPLIDEVGKTINRMNLEGREAAKVFDILFVASQQTNVPMQSLASTLNAYGPVLTNLGLGLEDQVALMSQLTAAGLDVSRVMPGINAFMRKLAAEGVTDLGAAFEEQIKAIANAKTETEALNIATEAFGAEGAQRLVVAARTGTLDIDALSASLGNAEGAIQVTSAATRTWQENLAILKNKVLVKLEPVLTDIIDKLTEFTDWLSRKGIPMAEDFGEVLRKDVEPWVNNLRVAFDRLKPTVVRIGDALRTLITFLDDNREIMAAIAIAITITLVPAFVAWAVSAGAAAVATALALAPIILIIAAIALLVLGIIKLVQHWDDVTAAVRTVINWMQEHKKIMTAVGIAMAVLLGPIGILIGGLILLVTHWETVTAFIKAAWSATMAFLLSSVGQLRDFFVGNFTRIKEFIMDAWGTAVSFVVEKAIWVKDQIVAKWGTLKTKVIEIVTGIKDKIVEKFNAVVDFVKGLGTRLFDAGKSAFTMLSDGIKSGLNAALGVIESGLNKLINGVNRVIRGLNKFDVLGVVPDIPTISTVSIPRLAHGGIVAETGLAVVHKGETFSGVGGGVGGVTVNMNISGPFLGDAFTARKLAREIKRELDALERGA